MKLLSLVQGLKGEVILCHSYYFLLLTHLRELKYELILKSRLILIRKVTPDPSHKQKQDLIYF